MTPNVYVPDHGSPRAHGRSLTDKSEREGAEILLKRHRNHPRQGRFSVLPARCRRCCRPVRSPYQLNPCPHWPPRAPTDRQAPLLDRPVLIQQEIVLVQIGLGDPDQGYRIGNTDFVNNAGDRDDDIAVSVVLRPAQHFAENVDIGVDEINLVHEAFAGAEVKDHVIVPALGENVNFTTIAAIQFIVACAAGDVVMAVTAMNGVIAGAAILLVEAGAAPQIVVASPAGNSVVPAIALQTVVGGIADQGIVEG